jgi:queuine/archaeosine tRNA-ribosyltransferase
MEGMRRAIEQDRFVQFRRRFYEKRQKEIVTDV